MTITTDHVTSIAQALPATGRRQYTPEEIEASRRAVARRNAICDPDCPICGGTGYVSVGGGKTQVCSNHFRAAVRRNPARYGLAENEIALTWGDMLPIAGGDKTAAAVRRWLEGDSGWLYIYGDHGLAKSLSLKICVAAYLNQGQEAAYTNMAGILDNLRAAFDQENPSDTAQARLDWWAGLPLLAIDELDRIHSTPWAVERRFVLLDTRYTLGVRGAGKTIITANVAPEQIDANGQDRYIADRIRDSRFTVLQVRGESARGKMSSAVRY